MKYREKYIHTRNYGCRLRRFFYNDVEMLSLENAKIKIVIALGKGADIVEFVHKPTDVDFMWHSFNELKNVNQISTVASTGGNFLDTYAGGWQELFPTYGGGTHYHGAEIGIHGEACLYPWECQVITDEPECVEVLLSLRMVRSPFLLEKTLRIRDDSAKLFMHQKIVNLGVNEMDFMWGHHPAFGFPFLDESVEIRVKGTPKVTVPGFTIAHRCPFDKETAGVWPMLPDKNGNMRDMSRVSAPEEKVYSEYYLSQLEVGEYEVISHNRKLGMRMSWDPTIFKYIWVWALYGGIEEYPWYGRSYVLGVEPWSSMPGNYETAKANNDLLLLKPGESLETEVTAEIFICA